MGRENPIERAKRLGTYGKVDRSAQYEAELQTNDFELRRKLLRNDNLLFARMREADDRKFRHHIFAMLTAAVLARAPEIYRFVVTFFQRAK